MSDLSLKDVRKLLPSYPNMSVKWSDPATLADLASVFSNLTIEEKRKLVEALGGEVLQAWLSEDPEFGEDLWALPVEKKGTYAVLPLDEGDQT